MAEYVKVEQDGRVAIVTLDHPPVNALSSKLLEELEEEYDRLDRDDETRAIVLRGEGEKAFVAGADITEFPAMREQIEEAAETGSARGIQKLAARMDAGRTPVIAAIHGYCLGGGLELALACDLRLAAEGILLGMPPAKLGLVYSHTGLRRFVEAIGAPRTRELFLLGRNVDAATAFSWGLVNGVLAPGELDEVALDTAQELADNAPLSVRGTKRVLRELARADGELDPEVERELLELRHASFVSEDLREGVRAFGEKRPARWKGR